MEAFYRRVRKGTGILTGDGKPMEKKVLLRCRQPGGQGWPPAAIFSDFPLDPVDVPSGATDSQPSF